MGAKLKHFLTILKHKAVVYKECRECGIPWRGVFHDLSKFSPAEFSASAKYFQGNRSPIEAEKEDCGYSVAWLHHKGRNRHHWEWWTDFDSEGKVIAYKIPSVYVIEMLCDWIGAGKVYNGGRWTNADPLNYYNKVRAGRYFHPETEALIIKLLEKIRDEGLESFHDACRGNSSLFLNYDGYFKNQI